MAVSSIYPQRRRALCIKIDADADQLLRAMALPRGFGLLVSELIRKEAAVRTERPAMLAALRERRGTEAAAGAGEAEETVP
jgi:hypothetical protein